MSYNPIPPRVWSRVQNPCTYTDASGNSDINYNEIFIPLTGQTVSQAQANYEDKLIYKGNILQYKGNSAKFTKSQKYTQLAKGFGPNRKKVFATQSQTYSNPNTTGLQRINSKTYPYPNAVVGEPNNISGPFQYNVQNPNGCSGTSLQDGGTLRCGYYTNPCTGEIIRSGVTSATICNPASASNVPGSSILCWNSKVQTWFPRQRYFMNNSTDKWPVNYKGFVSAVDPSSYTNCLTKNETTKNYNNFNILSNILDTPTTDSNEDTTRATITTYYSIPEIGYVELPETTPQNGVLTICNLATSELTVQSLYDMYNIFFALTGKSSLALPPNTTAIFTYMNNSNGDIIIQANIF